MAIKTKIIGREALSRRLRQLVPEAEKAAAPVKVAVAREAARLIADKAPYDTGEYAESIHADLQRNNAGKRPLSGSQSKDPDATAVYAHYKWRFLEFGTRPHINGGLFAGSQHPGTSAQPHIFPTWRAYRPKALRKVRDALNKAVRKARKR